MATAKKRHFKGEPAEMLTALSTILEAADENKSDLIAKRASWADPFFPNLGEELDGVVQPYLGADSVH